MVAEKPYIIADGGRDRPVSYQTKIECPGCSRPRTHTAIEPPIDPTFLYYEKGDGRLPASLYTHAPYGVILCPCCNDYRPATAAEQQLLT